MAEFVPPEVQKASVGQWIPPEVAKTPPPPKENPAFSGSFGNVVRNFPQQNPLKDIGAGIYGAATSTLGLGDSGLNFIPGLAPGIPALPLPTTKQVREATPKALTPAPEEAGYVTAGEYAPAVVSAGGLAKTGLGALSKGLSKVGAPLIRDLTGVGSVERSAKLAESLGSGQMGKNILSRATKAGQERKIVADRLYKQAKDRMAERYANGDLWQTSESGKQFFADLAERLRTDQATNVTSDTRKVLTDLYRDLVGTQKVGGGKAYSSPEVLRATLRELRDAASGEPKEGFKALGQQEAGDLANKLSESLAQWEPSLKEADTQYQALTKKLYPEGVEPGKFAKEKKTATKTINLLENRLKQGTVKPEDVTTEVRKALRSPQVARLVKEEDARQINAEIDAIDKIKDREKKVQATAKFIAKATGYGILGGMGVGIGERIL